MTHRQNLLKKYFKERKDKKKGIVNKKSSTVIKQNDLIANSIQIVSDIHLEFANVINKMPKIKVQAPILALLGDIGYPKSNEYKQFIADCASKFQYVIIITGNHEYYDDVYDNVHDRINSIASLYNNVYFLQCSSLELNDIIPNTVILGCTLWVKFDNKYASEAMDSINDYSWIYMDNDKSKTLTVQDTNKFYDSHLQFIVSECEKAQKNNKKVIILTHHAPTDYKTIDPNYYNQISYLMNFTNIENLLQPPVVCWVFGHTHFNMDLLVKVDLKQMQYTDNDNDNDNNKLLNSVDNCIGFVDNPDNDNNNDNVINDDNNNNNNDVKVDDNDDNIWYTRLATNQQGYLHRGIADGYVLKKVIKFPITVSNDNTIEVIDYSRLVVLPYMKRIYNLNDD